MVVKTKKENTSPETGTQLAFETVITKKENTSPETGTQLAFETVIKVDIRNIKHNPYQPEGRIEPPQDVVERIAASIKEHGLLQTPVVRKCLDGLYYEMGDGWIRLKGYELLAKQGTLSSEWYFMPVVIRNLTDKQMADLVMEANTVRNDLSPIDLAKFYQRYLEDFKITQTELARLHNVSQGEIANTLRLLDLPETIQKQVISQEISETHARYLLQVKDPKQMNKFANDIIKNKTSVDELDRRIKYQTWDATRKMYKDYDSDSRAPQFDTWLCEGCEHKLLLKQPYNAGDEKKTRCADANCWDKKQKSARETAHQKEIDNIKAQGVTNFPDKRLDFYKSLSGWEYERIGKPKECQTCPKRAAIPDYSGKYGICCVDKKCFEDKAAVKEKADDHAQAIEAEKAEKYIEDVFKDLPVNKQSLQTTLECLFNSIQDAEPVLKFVKAFNLFEIRKDEDLEEQDDLREGIISAIKEKEFDLTALIRMIIRLSFEIFMNDNHYGNADQETIDQLLNSFKAAHQGQPAATALPPIELQPYTLKKIGSDWVAVNDEKVIIAVGSSKESADRQAKDSYIPISTVINPKYSDYMLNHTYRISFATNKNLDGDVTAQDVNTAITALGGSSDDVEEIKVHKCSGKPSTGGGVGCGWGKCTEVIEDGTETG